MRVFFEAIQFVSQSVAGRLILQYYLSVEADPEKVLMVILFLFLFFSRSSLLAGTVTYSSNNRVDFARWLDVESPYRWIKVMLFYTLQRSPCAQLPFDLLLLDAVRTFSRSPILFRLFSVTLTRCTWVKKK